MLDSTGAPILSNDEGLPNGLSILSTYLNEGDFYVKVGNWEETLGSYGSTVESLSLLRTAASFGFEASFVTVAGTVPTIPDIGDLAQAPAYVPERVYTQAEVDALLAAQHITDLAHETAALAEQHTADLALSVAAMPTVDIRAFVSYLEMDFDNSVTGNALNNTITANNHGSFISGAKGDRVV